MKGFVRTGMAALVIAGLACGGAGSGLTGTIGSGQGNGNGNGNGNPTTAAVSVVNFTFQPLVTNVRPGGTVTWTWRSDTTTHDIVFDDGVLNAGPRASGAHVRTFLSPGTYGYRCSLHGAQEGAVIVQ
jgi:plastocyanin